MGAGNVSIVNIGGTEIGVTRDQKRVLLSATGLSAATIEHCLDALEGEYETATYGQKTVLQSPDVGQAVIVQRPAQKSTYGAKTKINSSKPLRY